MCDTTVYIDKAGQMEEVLKDVVSLAVDGQELVLTTLLGDTKQLKGKIKHIDFLKHTVTVEPV